MCLFFKVKAEDDCLSRACEAPYFAPILDTTGKPRATGCLKVEYVFTTTNLFYRSTLAAVIMLVPRFP